MAGSPGQVVNIFFCQGLVPHTAHQAGNLFCPIDHNPLSIRFSSLGPRWATMAVARSLSTISGIKLFECYPLNQEESPAKTLLLYATCRYTYTQRPLLKLHPVVIVGSKK